MLTPGAMEMTQSQGGGTELRPQHLYTKLSVAVHLKSKVREGEDRRIPGAPGHANLLN